MVKSAHDCIIDQVVCLCEMAQRLIDRFGCHLRLHGPEGHLARLASPGSIAIFWYAGFRLSTRAQRGASVQVS